MAVVYMFVKVFVANFSRQKHARLLTPHEINGTIKYIVLYKDNIIRVGAGQGGC